MIAEAMEGEDGADLAALVGVVDHLDERGAGAVEAQLAVPWAAA